MLSSECSCGEDGCAQAQPTGGGLCRPSCTRVVPSRSRQMVAVGPQYLQGSQGMRSASIHLEVQPGTSMRSAQVWWREQSTGLRTGRQRAHSSSSCPVDMSRSRQGWFT